MLRDSEDAAFRRTLRLADRSRSRVRLAEAGAERLRKSDASAGFADVSAPVAAGSFTPVRLVTPWHDAHSSR